MLVITGAEEVVLLHRDGVGLRGRQGLRSFVGVRTDDLGLWILVALLLLFFNFKIVWTAHTEFGILRVVVVVEQFVVVVSCLLLLLVEVEVIGYIIFGVCSLNVLAIVEIVDGIIFL